MNEEFYREIIEQTAFENVFLNVLREAHASGEALQILCNGQRDSTETIGVVEHIYPDTVALRKLDECGDDDGFAVLRINRIRRIRRNTRELCRIIFLQEQESCGAFSASDHKSDTKVDGIYAELELALATGTPVECTLELGRFGEYATGLVQRLCGEYCQMLIICPDGDPDGTGIFRWREVHSIERDTPELQQMMALHHARHHVYDKADPQA